MWWWCGISTWRQDNLRPLLLDGILGHVVEGTWGQQSYTPSYSH